MDDRSDDKGPESEGVTIASLFGRTYLFVMLERIGGGRPRTGGGARDSG